jgi:hypothetical protein
MGRVTMSGQGNVSGHVFISYVREDALHVDRLQSALESHGIRVWRDTEDLLPGEDWRRAIGRAISEGSVVFLACFSRNSASRDRSFQNEELVLAVEQLRLRSPDKPWLMPVRFDDCPIPDLDIGAGRTLASIHWADLFGEAAEDATARLVTAVRKALAARHGAVDSDHHPVGPGGRGPGRPSAHARQAVDSDEHEPYWPGTVPSQFGHLVTNASPLVRPVPLREAQTLRGLSVAVVVSIIASIVMWFYGFATYTNGQDMTSDSIHAFVALAIFVTTVVIIVRWMKSLPRGIMALRREKAGRLEYERASKAFMESNRLR